MDKDFMLNYFNKAVQPEWEELLKTPRYQPAASKRDAIEREFFRMLNDEQKRKYLDLESAVILAECDIAEAMYMKGAADRELMIRYCHELRLLLRAVGRVVLLLPHPESTVPRPPLPAAFHRCPDAVRHPAGPHEPVRKERLAGRAGASVYRLHRPGSAGIPLLRRAQGGQAVPGVGGHRPHRA